jgi:hypothetical protein
MTGWRVEREPRTAFPSPVPPVGAPAHMPPSSQGAERRGERRSGRTGARWGLRALVVGGLAGAAWLLTGAAAHAADRDSAPELNPLGSSLIGAVVDGDTAPPAIDRVLQAADQPLEPHRPARTHDVTSSVVTAPARVLAQPVRVVTETLDEVTRVTRTNDATTALGAVDRVVREVSGPLRLTGGPADPRQLAPVTAPLTRPLRPVTDLLQQHTAAPSETDAEPAPTTTAPATAGPRGPRATGTAATGTDPASGVPAPGATAEGDGVGPTGSARQRQTIVADRIPTTATAAAPGTVRDHTPGGDGPAPLRGHLGAVSGIPTSASGAPAEGGSMAVLPAAVADDATARCGLRDATDVEARRHTAEAPTVSPD